MRGVKFNGESLLEEHVVSTDLNIIHKRFKGVCHECSSGGSRYLAKGV